MKAYVAEKQAQVKVTELADSKTFQEFKREQKALVKEEDQRYIAEEYQQDMENAAWRMEAAKVKVEDVLLQREIKTQQRQLQRQEEEENRALQQSLEMANMARELEREKSQLL